MSSINSFILFFIFWECNNPICYENQNINYKQKDKKKKKNK